MFDIVTATDDKQGVLRRQAARIPDPTAPGMGELVSEMITVMRRSDGVGIAAPQIGLPIRLFVIETGGRVSVFFNPNIVSYSEEKSVSEEGCLSVPGEFYPIERSSRISMEYQDIEGKKSRIDADGFLAVVLQHEYDHLEGILIVDRFKKQKPENAYAL